MKHHVDALHVLCHDVTSPSDLHIIRCFHSNTKASGIQTTDGISANSNRYRYPIFFVSWYPHKISRVIKVVWMFFNIDIWYLEKEKQLTYWYINMPSLIHTHSLNTFTSRVHYPGALVSGLKKHNAQFHASFRWLFTDDLYHISQRSARLPT